MTQSVLGLYFDEFEVGSEIKHSLSKTIFESDNNFFSLMTMNHHPVHTNIDIGCGDTRFFFGCRYYRT